MKTKVYIPCKCGHYEGVHRDPVCHFNACETCSMGDASFADPMFTFNNETFICSGYKPMDGLGYIQWLEKQKVNFDDGY